MFTPKLFKPLILLHTLFMVTSISCMELDIDTEKIEFGTCSLQGSRPHNEDTFCVATFTWEAENRIARQTAIKDSPLPVVEYYAIFDGHGGSDVSRYLKYGLLDCLIKKYLTTLDQEAIDDALKKSFEDINNTILSNDDFTNQGSTGLVVIKVGMQITTALVGDSRAAVLCGSCLVDLTKDQNLRFEEERVCTIKRLEAKGVEDVSSLLSKMAGVWRIACLLNIARSFGDSGIAYYLTAEPVITHYQVTKEDNFLILASDGVWEFVDKHVDKNDFRKGISHVSSCWQDVKILSKCIADLADCSEVNDNFTVIAVKLN